MMNYSVQYSSKNFKTPPEQNSGEIKIEKAGYIPAKKRIENLMLAGQQLLMSRSSQFDFPDGEIDENFYDPTRKKGLDMGEAFQMQQLAKKRVKELMSVKPSQTVPDGPDKALEDKTDISIG